MARNKKPKVVVNPDELLGDGVPGDLEIGEEVYLTGDDAREAGVPDPPRGRGRGVQYEYAGDPVVAERIQSLRSLKLAQEVKRASLLVQQLEDSLVPKSMVYDQLFLFGQQLRQKIESIPDRCIDRLMVAKTRAEAYEILSKELGAVLREFSTPETLGGAVKITNVKNNEKD